MTKRKFKEPERKNLPAGTHSPCLLEVKFERATEEKQKQVSWELKNQWRFRFTYHKPGSELHEHTAVQWCNDCDSTLGNLYAFLTDLNGGEAPEDCDPESFDGKWFCTRVRKKGDNQFRAVGADPIDGPANYNPEKDSRQVQNGEVVSAIAKDDGGAGGDEDADIPF